MDIRHLGSLPELRVPADRPRLPRGIGTPWLVLLLALAGAVLFAVRLPFLSPVLANWDAAQFALGTLSYNVEHHQPHPPGYLLYIALGMALNTLTGDPNRSLTLISAASAAIATVTFGLLLVRMRLPREASLVALVAFAASPLLWYYSTVALTYAPDAAFAALVGLFAWETVRSGQGRWLVAGAIVLAVAGGFRQTTEVLLLPLWLFSALWVRPRWHVLPGLAALLLASAAWFVPLLFLAGGPQAYFRASSELASTIASGSGVLFQGTYALTINLVLVTFAGIAATGVAVLAAAMALPRLPSLLRRGTDRRVLFVLAWLVPALTVYTFGHIGQAGYMLLVLPALLLVVAGSVGAALRGTRWRWPLAAGLMLAIAAGNGALVTAGRSALDNAINSESNSTVATLRDGAMWQAPLFGVVPTGRDWPAIQRLLEGYAPGEVVVLTGTDVLSTFRHAAYYFPQYMVYAVAPGGDAGLYFEARDHQSTYSIEGFGRPVQSLPIAAGTRAVLVIDNYLADSLQTGREVQPIQFDDGNWVFLVPLDGQAQTLFVSNAITISDVPRFVAQAASDRPLEDELVRREIVRAFDGGGEVAAAPEPG